MTMTIMLWCWWRIARESTETMHGLHTVWSECVPYGGCFGFMRWEITSWEHSNIFMWWLDDEEGEGWMNEWARQEVKSCCFCWCKTHLNKALHPLNRLPTTWKAPAVTGYSLNFSLFPLSSFCSQLCFSNVMFHTTNFFFILLLLARSRLHTDDSQCSVGLSLSERNWKESRGWVKEWKKCAKSTWEECVLVFSTPPFLVYIVDLTF